MLKSALSERDKQYNTNISMIQEDIDVSAIEFNYYQYELLHCQCYRLVDDMAHTITHNNEEHPDEDSNTYSHQGVED